MSAPLNTLCPTGHSRGMGDRVDTWEIVRPPPLACLAGVRMAGFRIPGAVPLDLRAIPHPAVTVVIDFGDRMPHTSIAAGVATSPFDVRADGIECIQIRLAPERARAAFGMPLRELQAQPIALDDLWGAEVPRLRERLHDAPTWEDRFDLVTAHLRRQMATVDSLVPEIAEAWRLITHTRGRVRAGDVADAVGWSRQRLWSRFGDQLGLTPKRASMLVRFDHAMHRLLAGESQATVAAEAGYVDQSHFHREIRLFTGRSVAAALAEPWLAADAYAWPAGRGSAAAASSVR